MEHILKLAVTGSNNFLKLDPGQYAFLRQPPFTSNTLTGTEVAAGIFSFDIARTNFYQLWSGVSLTALSNNPTFSSSLTGGLLFGDDINISALTSSTQYSIQIAAISSSLISLSGSVTSQNADISSLSSYVGNLSRYTLSSTFIATTANLQNQITSLQSATANLQTQINSLTGGGGSLTAGVILQKSSGQQLGFSSVTAAIAGGATAGDIIRLYKNTRENITLPNLVTLHIDDGVIVDANDYTGNTIQNGGANFKITGRGIIRNLYDGITYTGISYMSSNSSSLYFIDNSGSVFSSSSVGASITSNLNISTLTSTTLNSLYFNSSTAFVGGSSSNSATLFRSTNGGGTWQEFNVKTYPGTAVDIRFFDSSTGVFFVNRSGTGSLVRTTDGGNTWGSPFALTALVATAGSVRNFVSAFANSITGFVLGGTSAGRDFLYRTTDSGGTWQSYSITSNAVFSGMKFVNSLTGFAACMQNDVPAPTYYKVDLFKTVDGGQTWSILPQNSALTSSVQISVNMPVIDFIDSNTGFLIFNNNNSTPKFYKTTDGGNTWSSGSTIAADTTQGNISVRMNFVNALTGYIFGGNSNGLRTVDGGDTWASFPISPSSTPGSPIYLGSATNADIQCDSIIGYGSNDVTVAAGPTVYAPNVNKLWLDANYIHSFYNCAVYVVSNNSVSALNINAKRISTGVEGRGNVGSSVIISHAGGIMNIDELEALGTGHCLGHRRYKLLANIKSIKGYKNNPTYSTYPVYVSQGTGNQELTLNFDEILASNGTFGSSTDCFSMTQGSAYIHGRSISSEGGIGISMDTIGGQGSLIADVARINAFRCGVYVNRPIYTEIKNATISASRTAGLNSAVAVVGSNTYLKNCFLYCSNTAISGYSIETQSGTGSFVKMVNTWSPHAMQSGVTALISSLNIDSNV